MPIDANRLKHFADSVRGAFELFENDPPSSESDQSSYSFACVAVMQLLFDMEEEELANRFLSLAIAFNELSEGSVAPIFKSPITSGKPGQRNDRQALWRVRAQVCIGIKLMEEAGIEQEEAIKFLLTLEPKFQKVLRTGSELKTAVKNWLKLFQNCAVPDPFSSAMYNEAIKDMPETRMKLSGEQMIGSGREMIARAAVEASQVI